MEIDSCNVLCPYCGEICGDSDSWEGSNPFDEDYLDFECEECGKKFQAQQVVTIDYRTHRDCLLNGEKHIKGKYHCTKCDTYNPSMKDGEYDENANSEKSEVEE